MGVRAAVNSNLSLQAPATSFSTENETSSIARDPSDEAHEGCFPSSEVDASILSRAEKWGEAPVSCAWLA
eukprot:CAMPEP_0205912012 /NCGR_PEP_ID=MMETSP1325-20131115/5540_1 /ASSEMBLY_ACC=CAM_ASM_000708 /TAXON_ID=236786 /ORGANISM="Florenciella sp., Strain RCC1007" /LENGTH=69 /DNA_ID=CAMNT_0053278629 /DNA_START=61 /DNA_END=267 /DNA_ORIENTATION=-